jgi:hypothetical protein
MAKRRYAFNPVGMDAWDPKPSHPAPGTHVVLSDQSGVGTRAGDFRYVEHADTGEFHGMVLKSSLTPVTKKNPGSPDPAEAARAAGLVNDRRGSREQCEYCGNYGHDYTVHSEAVRDVAAQRNKTDYP